MNGVEDRLRDIVSCAIEHSVQWATRGPRIVRCCVAAISAKSGFVGRPHRSDHRRRTTPLWATMVRADSQQLAGGAPLKWYVLYVIPNTLRIRLRSRIGVRH